MHLNKSKLNKMKKASLIELVLRLQNEKKKLVKECYKCKVFSTAIKNGIKEEQLKMY